MSEAAMVAAVDVGYGSVKAECGPMKGETKSIVMPSGAGRADDMPRKLSGGPDLKGGELVLLSEDGGPAVEWVAGVHQTHIQQVARVTHENYPSTPEYRALYLAALARFGVPKINLLVTGLPVNQCFGPDGERRKKALAQAMKGRKNINSMTTVEVERVIVIPQPIGTFMGVVADPKYAGLAQSDHLQTLVIDAGFYSVDYVVVSGRSIKDKSSGSSQLATSIILERTAAAVSRRVGRPVSRDQLDMAMKTGRRSIPEGLSGEIDFEAELTQVADSVATQVIGEILTALRTIGQVDLIIVTGGGGSLYLNAVRAAFPGLKAENVILPEDPVMANARGYRATGVWMLEKQFAKQRG